MRIQIAKQTPLANAPDELCYAINKWTEHEAFVSQSRDEIADIIMFNNRYFKTDIPSCMWYHSEPHWKGLMLDYKGVRMTNAQYHCTLPEYSDCIPVRNVINFDKPEYAYKPVERLRIAYSPSSKVDVGQWHKKGYEETVKALEGYDCDIITDTPLEECLRRKSECSVHIDECVTGSYHRCTLEGLAMGKVVIGWVSEEVDSIVTSITNSNLPIIRVKIDNLKPFLDSLSDSQRNINLVNRGLENRLWMIKHWHPRDIANEFIDIYKDVINEA